MMGIDDGGAGQMMLAGLNAGIDLVNHWQLQAEFNRLNALIQQYHDEAWHWKGEADKTQEALDSANNYIRRLKSDEQYWRNNSEQWESNAKYWKNFAQELSATIMSLNGQIDYRDATINHLEAIEKTNNTSLKEIREQREEVLKKIDDLQEVLEETESELERADERFQFLYEKHMMLEKRLKRQCRRTIKVKIAYDALVRDIAHLHESTATEAATAEELQEEFKEHVKLFEASGLPEYGVGTLPYPAKALARIRDGIRKQSLCTVNLAARYSMLVEEINAAVNPHASGEVTPSMRRQYVRSALDKFMESDALLYKPSVPSYPEDNALLKRPAKRINQLEMASMALLPSPDPMRKQLLLS
ncbi:hypothetical protein [Noviherbaspirillum malthae]|uniref:hypothetical protein n=1 Tax=Noviherbaspirillum malthae TaxID=1260987 RepID=UPI00188FD1DA|nr:hypothetical protein [Noviherbaspirillum malthae]